MGRPKALHLILLSLLSSGVSVAAVAAPQQRQDSPPPASNPAATDAAPGSGQLGRWLGLPADGPLRLGGAWVSNGARQWDNGLINQPQLAGLAQQILVDLSLDLEQALSWSGARVSVQGLQTNASRGADATGSIQGANSLLTPPPLNRTELYAYALTQSLFDHQLRIKIGKLVASNSFANVDAPDAGPKEWNYWIPSISSLTYTPLYAMPTLIGRLPGYPNSALGASLHYEPSWLKRKLALQAGVFDGRGATGLSSPIETGMATPALTGPLFSIIEMTAAWSLGAKQKPGNLGVGFWNQSGPLRLCDPTSSSSCLSEAHARGAYLIGQQRLVSFRYPSDNSGIASFMQMGVTSSLTNLMTASIGAGLTMFSPLRNRPLDSYGVGLSWARMNDRSFLANAVNPSELMIQIYGQIHLLGDTYITPAITYLPVVGTRSANNRSTSMMLQLTTLF